LKTTYTIRAKVGEKKNQSVWLTQLAEIFKTGNDFGLMLRWRNCGRLMNLETLSITADPGRTFWPERANNSEPFFKFGAEPSRTRVLYTPELIRKSEGAEQWNLFIVTRRETAIAKPDKEVQHAGSRMQDPNGIEIRGNGMRHHFTVKLIAEDDDVLESFGKRQFVPVAVVPDPRFSKKIEASGMDHLGTAQ